MRASAKTILFARITKGGKAEQRPVAVFANEDAARPYAVAIMTAYKASDVVRLKSLDMEWLAADDKTVHPGLKFSRVTVPYAPEAIIAEDDPFADASSATS